MRFRQIALTQQMVAILLGLFESRVMSSLHVAAFRFAGRREAAKKAIQSLKVLGLIAARPLNSTEPHVLSLTPTGIHLLSERGFLKDYPALSRGRLFQRSRVSELTLRHELFVMDVKVAFVTALPAVVAEFTTWPALVEFTAALPNEPTRIVKPDGFFRLRDGGMEHAFFLEVDRSTEKLDILVSRLRRYVAFYKAGGFAARCGSHPSEFAAHPFRVLVVLESEERRNNVAEALVRGFPPVLTQVWLSTRVEVCAAPLSPCWIRPVDYRDATATMPEIRPAWDGRYRRDRVREARIAAVIRRHALIDASQTSCGLQAA